MTNKAITKKIICDFPVAAMILGLCQSIGLGMLSDLQSDDAADAISKWREATMGVVNAPDMGAAELAYYCTGLAVAGSLSDEQLDQLIELDEVLMARLNAIL